MGSFLHDVFHTYRLYNGRLLSGSIAFYAILGLAPLGVVVLGIAAMLIPEAVAEKELVVQLETFLGEPVARFIAQAIAGTSAERDSLAAALFSTLFIVYVSVLLFSMLRRALNHLWSVRPKPYRQLGPERFRLVRKRLMGFVMLIVLALSLVVLVAARAALAAASRFLERIPYLLPATNFLLALVVIAVVIAVVFRLIPDARVAWRDLWVGAAVTAPFTVVVSYLSGAYLGYASPASAYGAAGTLLVLLLWVYYTTQIFLLGAVFIRLWAERGGRPIAPKPYAVGVSLAPQPAEASTQLG
jgi:membrane protein